MIQPARVVAVAMGDNGKIELPQVDTLGFDIVREDLGIVARVEQIRLPPYSTRAANPQSFVIVEVLPKAS